MPNRPGLLSAIVIIALIAFAILIPLATLMCQDGPGACIRFLSSVPGALPALATMLSVFVAVVAFFANATISKRQQRKQHTVNLLFETRFSAELRDLNRRRKLAFPEYKTVAFDPWLKAYKAGKYPSGSNDQSPEVIKSDGARALVEMLNYYEYLAVGIAQGDLHHGMLKESLRGIMCSFVDDARCVIAGIRQKNPRAYKYLVELYALWRDDTAVDMNGERCERRIPSSPNEVDTH